MKSFLFYIKYVRYNEIEECILKIDSEEYTKELKYEADRILKYIMAKLEIAKEYINNQIRILRCNLIENSNDIIKFVIATKIFIYKDCEINDYVMRRNAEPDLSIFNYLNDKLKTKIFIIGNQIEYNNKNNLDMLERLISRYVRCNSIDTSFFNLKTENGDIDYSTLQFTFDKNNKNKIYVILLENIIKIDDLEKISMMLRYITNLYVMIRNNNIFYRVSLSSNKIILNKVTL